MNKQLLRNLPQIDALLEHGSLSCYKNEEKNILLKSARSVVEEFRKKILNGDINSEKDISPELIIEKIKQRIEIEKRYRLRRVINATGVVLHTNLGRSRLPQNVLDNLLNIAGGYSNLEYDLASGQRGSRHDHVESLLKDMLGVEAAMTVNNNAAATMLSLSALAEGKKAIVSRGELVEVGGSFRIPDIMKRSGSALSEVGTTNKTNAEDYENAVDEETAIILKVHTSNYRIMGFTAETTIAELRGIADKYKLPLIHDLGSGLMDSLADFGIDETSVKSSVADGADVVLFSGDKMLGGPQCGIIAGKKDLIDKMKKHPIARVVRVDKLTLACLEATLFDYLYSDDIKKRNPTLSMISADKNDLQKKAEKLKKIIDKNTDVFKTEVVASQGQVGGGSAPLVDLDGFAVSLSCADLSAQKIERKFRKSLMPVIVRLSEDRVLLDVRTIEEGEFQYIVDALKNMAAGKNE